MAATASALAEPSLLEILTQKILADELTVEEARLIVLRREFYRKNGLLDFDPPKNMQDLEILRKRLILRAIHKHRHVKAAARELGMPHTSLYRELQRMGYPLRAGRPSRLVASD